MDGLAALNNGETVNVTIGTLPATKPITIVFDAQIDPAPTNTQVCNQGQAAYTGGGAATLSDDPSVGGAMDPTCTDLDMADLAVVKTESSDPVIAGNSLTYVITVTNNGPRDTTAVTLSELITLPTGASITSITPSGGSTYNPPASTNGTWSVGSLTNGSSRTLTVVIGVGSATAHGAQVCDTVSVINNSKYDPNSANNTKTECTTVNRQIDLVVVKTESADPVVAGSGSNNLTYLITVTNSGPSDATNVVVRDVLTTTTGLTGPIIYNYTGDTSFNIVTGSTGDWTIPSLPAGQSRTLSIQMTAGPATPVGTNTWGDTATVTGSSETRINTGNDSVTVLTSIARQVDLKIGKTESIDPVIAGSGSGNLTYVVTITNTGPSDTALITVSELITIPSGTTIDSITAQSGSSYSPPNAANGTWTISGLAKNATKTLTIVLTVGGSTSGGTDVIGDSATVTGIASNETRTNTTDDSVTVKTSVVGQIDLTVAKFESSDPVIAGANLTYTIVVTNNGPAAANNVTVTELITLSAGATISSITPQSGTTYAPSNGNPGTWSIPFIALGASKTLTVVIATSPTMAEGTDVIADTATVTGSSNEIINPGDDSDTESTSVVRRVDLKMTKTESVDPVVAGSGSGNLVYVVTLTNQGPSDASGIVASEIVTFPANVTLDSIVAESGTSYAPPNTSPGTWTIGSVPAGGTRKLTVTLTVDQSAVVATDVIADTASVTASTETRINTGDDSVTVATSITRNIDLVVAKSESADPVGAGSGPGNLTYVITVTNNGPSDASGVALSELITTPTGTTIDSITAGGGTSYAPPNSSPGTWTVGALAVGESRTLTVVLTVGAATSSGTNVVGDTATVSASNETRVNTSNDSATERTTVSRSVDLHLSKTESADPVLAGSGSGNLTYVITISNTGPSDASNITVSELVTLPSGTTIASITAESGSSYAPPNTSPGTWSIPSLALGATKRLTVVLTVGGSTASGTDTVGDTATITGVGAGETRANTGDDVVTERTSVTRQVDLAVTKSESADPVVAGSGSGNLTYVVAVTNTGPSDASNVTLSEVITLPTGTTISSITAQSGSTYAPPNTTPGTWTITTLAAGASKRLTVTLTVGAATATGTDVVGDTATVTGANEPLANTGNDSATERTSVTRNVDIGVTKTESSDPVTAGSGTGNLTYIITATNSGPSDATNVTISEVITLPTGTTIASITPQAGSTYAPANSTPGTWTIASLPAGTTKTLTVVLTVGASTAEGTDTVGDTATVTGGTETLINPGNDTVTVKTSVIRRIDLKVTKVESVDPVVAGGSLIYTVTVQNLGPSDASGVALSENVTQPAGTTIGSITPEAPTTYAPPNAANGTWTVGSLPSGGSKTLTVVINIASSAAPGTGVVGDVAAVSATNETRINTGDDSAGETTSITRRVDLVVTKTESTDPVLAGSGPGNLTYIITVTNAGPSDASGVALSEVITTPTGVTIDSITPQAPTTYAPANASPGAWTVGNLPAGTSKRLTVVLTVGPATQLGTDVIGDTASVSASNEQRINTGDDSATELTSVQVVIIGLAKIDSPDPVQAGTVLTFNISFTNSSPIALANPRITDTLPTTNVTFNSTVPAPGWTCSGPPTVVCTTPSMPAYSTANNLIKMNVNVMAPAGYKINNTVNAHSGTGNQTRTATSQSTVYRSRFAVLGLPVRPE